MFWGWSKYHFWSFQHLTFLGGWGPKPPFSERLANGRRPLKKTASDGADRQTDKQTDRQTLQLRD